MTNKKKNIIIISTIITISIIYISLIFNNSLWADECYTMLILQKNIFSIIKTTALDVHPPLYYLIAKIFTSILGNHVWVVKLVSILPVILSMIFIAKKSKKIFKENSFLISLLYIFLISLCPIAFTMNVELRMYTWTMFFVTCSGIYAYELYKEQNNKKALSLFILSSLCSAYTHYYAALAECYIYLFLIISLIKNNKSNWKLCWKFILLTIIGFLPWLLTFINQFKTTMSSWWLTSFNGQSILDCITYLFEGEFTKQFLLLFSIIIIMLIHEIIQKNKNKDLKYAMFLLTTFILTILTGIILSILIRPIFITRCIYPVIGLLFLGICITIANSNYKTLISYTLIGLLLINTPFSYYQSFNKEYKNGTKDFTEFINKNIATNETISTDIEHMHRTILKYYFPNHKIKDTVNENTKDYIITYKNYYELSKLLKNKKYKLVYQGNVDSKYYINIFYVEKDEQKIKN